MKIFKKRGFTLVELMVTISIAGILAAIILVNLDGARTKTNDNGIFSQIASTQGMAFKCLTSGNSAVVLKNSPHPTAGSEICSLGAAYSTWPTLVANSGWIYSATRFRWCNLANSNTACSPYNNATCGGNRTSGAFCYKFINNTTTSKIITCTQNGCVKTGF